MSIVAGFDSKTRERVYTANFDEQKEFAREVFKTSAGKRFLNEFENTGDNLAVVMEAAQKIYPDAQHITVSMYVDGMAASMNRAPSLERWKPGLLQRKPAAPVVAPTPEPEVPRDKNGKALTASQQAW